MRYAYPRDEAIETALTNQIYPLNFLDKEVAKMASWSGLTGGKETSIASHSRALVV